MVLFAYPIKSYNNETDTLIYSNNCNSSDLNKIFYCPNPHCRCEMSLCSLNSNSKSPYFKVKSKFSHIDNCSYFLLNNYLPKKKVITLNFDIENLYNLINSENEINLSKKINKTNKLNKKSKSIYNDELKTLRNLYDFCCSNPINTKFGGKDDKQYKISDIICFPPTSHIYTKFISGIKLIECKYNSYTSSDEKNLYLLNFLYPFNSNSSSDAQFNIKIFFKNKKSLNFIKDYVYNHKKPILLFSNWKTENNTVITSNISKKFVIPLK